MIIRIFYDVNDSGGTGTADSLPALDDMDVIEGEQKDDDIEETTEEEPKEDEGEVKAEEDDEDKEEEETQDEEEEEEEEPKEVVSADGRISVKALKEQYPDIFKKNPGLKDVIFREREYSKRFGSIEDADEAYAKSESFDNFENTLLQGGIGQLIDAIADTDQEAALKCAENFLPELYARSKPIFAKVTLPIVKGMIRSTYNRAMNQGNKQLALACQYISRDLFETPDVIRATEMDEQGPDPRAEELDRQRQELYAQQVNGARNDVLSSVKGRLAKDIANNLTGTNMSDFTREALIDKITDELDSTLVKDKAHMAHLSSLWKKMSKTGFTSEAKARIISASLGRARQVLPAVIAKVKAQQKGGKNPPNIQKAKDKRIPNQPSSKSRSGSPTKLDRNMSDFEFISK